MPLAVPLGLVALNLLFIIGGWRMFEKARRPGWKSVVPVYNLIIFLDIVDRSRWWVLWFLLPFVNLICGVIVCVDLARAFGKSRAFAIGLVLLPPVFVPMLAFGDAQYQYDA